MVNAFVCAKRSLQFYEPLEKLILINNVINGLINDKRNSNTQGKYTRTQQLKKLKEDALTRI